MSYAALRTRSWVFTYYPRGNEASHEAEDVQRIVQVLREVATYGTYGLELCPDTGRVHCQGFVYFRNPRRFGSVRDLLAGAHIEPMRGSFREAIDYCHKDWDYKEFGVRPMDSVAKGEAEKSRWDQARDLAIAGQFLEIPSQMLICHYQNLRRIEADFTSPAVDLEEPCGIWIYGQSGFGKSKICREFWPNHYPKMANKWWDGYNNEEFVVLDDLDPNHKMLGHHLKIWSDQYVFLGEIKGRSQKLRPKLFIVTSQYGIRTIFEDADTRAALERRFKVFDWRVKYEVPDGLRAYSQEYLEAAEAHVSDAESVEI